MTVPYRPITRIQSIIDELGLTITYAFDDLVFIEHNAFLLQMKTPNDQVALFFNKESDEKEHSSIINKLQSAASKQEIVLSPEGLFSMEQAEDDKLKINFFPYTKAV